MIVVAKVVVCHQYPIDRFGEKSLNYHVGEYVLKKTDSNFIIIWISADE